MDNNPDIVILTSFDNSFEAHLLKSKLADEGIESFLMNENMVSLNPLFNITVGGIKLMVKNTDLENATIIMNSVQETPITNENEEIIRCPKCNSTNLVSNFKAIKSARAFFAFLFSLLVGPGTLPLYYDRLYYCKDCGTKFEIKN